MVEQARELAEYLINNKDKLWRIIEQLEKTHFLGIAEDGSINKKVSALDEVFLGNGIKLSEVKELLTAIK